MTTQHETIKSRPDLYNQTLRNRPFMWTMAALLGLILILSILYATRSDRYEQRMPIERQETPMDSRQSPSGDPLN